MKKSIISLSLVAGLDMTAAVQAEEASDWSFKVTPYAFANTIRGNADVGPINAPADLDFDQII